MKNQIVPKPLEHIETEGWADLSRGVNVKAPDAVKRTVRIFLDAAKLKERISYPITINLVYGYGEEGYRLSIKQERTRIEASTPHGVHDALESMRQLIYINGTRIPCQEIKDAPCYPWRGLMIDTVRHFFPIEWIRKIIDAMSLYHLSVFHWHLTDDQGWRFESKSHPELQEESSWSWRHVSWKEKGNAGFYTQEEMKELVEYAEERFITIVPELEMPGHSTALLHAMPHLGCTGGPYETETRSGVFEDVLCPGNEETYEVISDLLDEIISIFPSPFIHIGGDEAPTERWENCPKCRALAEKEGIDMKDLQYAFTKRVIKLVKDKGRSPIGWDEIAGPILKGKMLDEKLALMLWRGKDALKTALGSGHRVVLSRYDDAAYISNRQSPDMFAPGTGGYAPLKATYSMETSFPDLNDNHLILGGQCNLWTEKVEWPMWGTYMIFPRLLALSEAFWTTEGNKDYEDFRERIRSMGTLLGKCGLTFSFKMP